MEMEDHHPHHHHHHHHQQQHQYSLPDLRQLMNGRPAHFAPAIPQPSTAELFSSHHRNLGPQGHQFHDMMMVMPRGGLQDQFRADSSATCGVAAATATAANTATIAAVAAGGTSTPATISGLEAETGSFGGDGGTGRWPRQETLTLLEIRSRLDPKFKEANQKGPLWDEVSRIMSEEHGYQRSGKKCREKFENLYKYYKKTKEGKAGRQDGKHYRFFRQLEALYGETSNQASVPETQYVGNNFRFHSANNTSAQGNQEAFHSQKICDSLSLSNSSEFDSSSSDDNDLSTAGLMENDSTDKRRKRRGGRSWKVKIKDFIDLQMRKLMEKQEAWLEKLTKTLEQKEQERVLREEEWRKEETARMDREHKFWAKERAWIETRDAALMEALQKLTGKELKVSSPEELMTAELQTHSENQNENGSEIIKGDSSWPESEITRLIHLRTSMESRFQQSGSADESLWEQIADKMSCLGYDRSASICKEKWDNISNYVMKTKECNKKRKENSRGSCYFPGNDSLYSQAGAYCEINEQGPEIARLQQNDGSSPSNSNARNPVNDNCFRFLMSDGENLWENYGLKLSKGENQ